MAQPQPSRRSRGGDGARTGRRATLKRKFLTLLGLVAGVFAGGALYRRATGRRRERADVYFDDGSMVSFVDDSPEAGALLDVARAALAAVRP